MAKSEEQEAAKNEQMEQAGRSIIKLYILLAFRRCLAFCLPFIICLLTFSTEKLPEIKKRSFTWFALRIFFVICLRPICYLLKHYLVFLVWVKFTTKASLVKRIETVFDRVASVECTPDEHEVN
jgi:hypothetical protein